MLLQIESRQIEFIDLSSSLDALHKALYRVPDILTVTTFDLVDGSIKVLIRPRLRIECSYMRSVIPWSEMWVGVMWCCKFNHGYIG